MINSPWFPNLNATNHEEVGPPEDHAYNCLAWAAGFNDRWFGPFTGQYWPGNAPRDDLPTSLAIVYESLGFTECADGSLEAQVEKIVIYVLDNKSTHAARQLLNGRWTSKLGSAERINHDTPADLTGPLYGQVWKYMRRAHGVWDDLNFVYLFPLNRRAYRRNP